MLKRNLALAFFATSVAAAVHLARSNRPEERTFVTMLGAPVEGDLEVEEAEPPPEEGVRGEYEVSDHNEADSPFDSLRTNAAIGLGGGVGGRFGETYAPIQAVSGFMNTAANHAVTFAADVDTGAYSNVRRMVLTNKSLPPKNAVRVEEFVNYFPYEGLAPAGDAPIGASIEVSSCPWAPEHRLAHIVLGTAPIAAAQR